MYTQKLISRFNLLILSLLAAALLAGCGGGGGGGSAGGGSGLGGTAATGAPFDGIVYATDSNGIEVNVPVNADGSFSIPVNSTTPPYLLRAIPNGVGNVLYSFASEKNITINITPLTTLALYMTYNGDLNALYTAWGENTSALDDEAIEIQQKIINANLSTLYEFYNVDPAFYNFMNEDFDTDSTGIDGVLDDLDISIDFSGATVLVDGSEFVLNPKIDTSGINIGDFGIVEGSTWMITVSDSINDIQFSDVALLPSIPNDLEEFEALSEDEILADFQFQGLNISINITSLSYEVFGSGEIATIISGQLRGTVNVNGVIEGETINETVNLNTIFEWERIS